jgi:protein-tyrosine phosphatase
MTSAYRICFVCTGNICRSPAAEVVVRALAEQAAPSKPGNQPDRPDQPGLPDLILDSAGTGSWHAGEPADRRALRALRAAGYDGHAHRARKFDPAWFRERDLIVALDRGHATILRALAPDDESRARIRLMRSFDPSIQDDENNPLIDVPDPYYDGDAEFALMLEQIEAAGLGLLDHLRSLKTPL